MTLILLVNELSNTIDLESTLIRAESLFRRFQRTVEAIDKKNNFPEPPLRQRRPASTERPQSSGAVTTGAESSAGGSMGQTKAEKERIISPELRGLLSTKVEVLDKQTVQEHGGGVS